MDLNISGRNTIDNVERLLTLGETSFELYFSDGNQQTIANAVLLEVVPLDGMLQVAWRYLK